MKPQAPHILPSNEQCVTAGWAHITETPCEALIGVILTMVIRAGAGKYNGTVDDTKQLY